MQIATRWHPFEIWRQIRCVLQDCGQDFELRHPEVLKRWAYEMRARLSAADRERFSALTERFQSARHRLSFLDWPLLLDWGERRNQAQLLMKLSEIEAILHPMVEDGEQAPIIQSLQTRLQKIREEVREHRLPEQAGFWQILRYRVYFSPLRDEALYLMSRLQSVHPGEAPPSSNTAA